MIPQLAPVLAPIARWWAERHLRERLLVVACGTAGLLVAGDSLLTMPLERRLKQERSQLQTQHSQLEAARAAAIGAPGGAQNPREQAARLQQRVQAAQAASQTLRLQAAQAARLPETLRAITATVGSARLLALDFAGDAAAPPGGSAGGGLLGAATAASAPATPNNVSTPAVAAVAYATPHLYRLPITLKVSGTYEELHMLLTQIERHADALQWSTLTLDSSGWPAIQLTLKAHVLSPDPRWGAAS
jgi:type II secretory pathway component PulM